MSKEMNSTPAPTTSNVAGTSTSAKGLKELFGQYDAANQEVQEARTHLALLEGERGQIVKAIAEAIAPKKKITRGGKELTIVSRGETYYFRGPKETKPEDVVSVDD